MFVHLIDENDVIVAQRDMYPGQGNIATAETPADYAGLIATRCASPRWRRRRARLRWAVGAYNFQTGERLMLPRW